MLIDYKQICDLYYYGILTVEQLAKQYEFPIDLMQTLVERAHLSELVSMEDYGE